MPKTISFQNNFTRGLVTEATGLNFPENACTDANNVVFTLIGDVVRRPGIDFELNNQTNNLGNPPQLSVTAFKWVNAGGDGTSEILVQQNGRNLWFFLASDTSTDDNLSTTFLSSFIDLESFRAAGSALLPWDVECQFAIGNGYLFVFNTYCDPFYCTFSNGKVTATRIDVQIRDFLGIYPEPGTTGPIYFRPASLTAEHQYNLQNQGWTGQPTWTATQIFSQDPNQIGVNPFGNLQINTPAVGNTVSTLSGPVIFNVQTGLTGVTVGQEVTLSWTASLFVAAGSLSHITESGSAQGLVVSYSGNVLTIEVTTNQGYFSPANQEVLSVSSVSWSIFPGVSNNTITTFKSDIGLYPSNTDIWYTFKDDTNTFNPTATYASVALTTTPAPQGHFILDAFNQDRQSVSGVSGLTAVSTIQRPTLGAWFQGRVWYAGINASAPAEGDMQFYTWTENIYFSQIITPGDNTSFGYCYQQNDPTDETLFALLPTDGGVITIPGCGNIYKLFPIQNGMLVFARNGIWFITGSSGLGFTANDYAVTKISAVQSVSYSSFIDVNGLPMFWNAEGIYRVVQGQNNVPYGHGGFIVEPLTVGTILTLYNSIPLDSKIYARGDYDPINYVVKWIYRSTQESGITNRYVFDSALNFNLVNKAFYPYSFSSGPTINGLIYVNYTNSVEAPDPIFKYIASVGSAFTFAEERDETNWLDWFSTNNVGFDYTSTFTTGFSLQGKGITKWQPVYVYMYLRNEVSSSYEIYGIWDYATAGGTGRISAKQLVQNAPSSSDQFQMFYKRHKIRGHGVVLQINISSVSGQPFDIMGWSILNQVDAGV